MSNWYLQSGRESDVVISTRVRFGRNLEKYQFSLRCNKNERENIVKEIENITPSLGYGLRLFKLENIDDITKMSLVEKHLISPDFALNENNEGSILINDDENICVMINEEDHLRIQTFAPGLEIENTANLALEIEDKIGEHLQYAYHEKYGYLTSCPTNVGTGMRVSVMVFLPGLSMTGNINKVLEAVQGLGMNIRGVYGEGTKAQGAMYQISNKQTLGISEKEIAKNIKNVTEKVIEQERIARKLLAKNRIELEDRVYRKFGILSNCKKISWNEFKENLAEVKLGTDLGIIEELTDSKIMKLELYCKPANLQKYLGKTLDAYERDIERAEIIKKIVKEN